MSTRDHSGDGRYPAMEGEGSPDSGLRTNAGWIAGGLVIVGVFLVGLGLWIRYHP